MDIVPARLVGVLIQTDADALQWEAQELQKAWFAAPKDNSAKARYAYALKAWAKETRNMTAHAHALRLIAETETTP